MTDKELLELAAKAAGIRLEWGGNPDECLPMYYEGNTYHYFDPLTDDGDALRLAVKLGAQLVINPEIGITDCKIGDGDWCFGGEHHHPDGYAATRRAIVRAAAEIGRTK